MSQGSITIFGAVVRYGEPTTDAGRKYPTLVRSGAFTSAAVAGHIEFRIPGHRGEVIATTGDLLQVWRDSQGLQFRIDIPLSDASRALARRIQSGELNGASAGIEGQGGVRLVPVVDRRCVVFDTVHKITDICLCPNPANNRTHVRVLWPWDKKPEAPCRVKPEPEAIAAVRRQRDLASQKRIRQPSAVVSNADGIAEVREAARLVRQNTMIRILPDQLQEVRAQRNRSVAARVLGIRSRPGHLLRADGIPIRLRRTMYADQFPVQFRAQADAVDIWLHGEVGDVDNLTDSMSIGRVLADNRGKPVTLRVNSPGGLAYDGVAVFNALMAHDGPTTAIIEGLAGSAASLACIACDRVTAYSSATFHPHYSLGLAFGHAADIRNVLRQLETLDQQLVRLYSERSGRSLVQVRKDLQGPDGDGTVFSAQDAQRAGYVHEVLTHERSKPRRAAASTSWQDSMRKQASSLMVAKLESLSRTRQ